MWQCMILCFPARSSSSGRPAYKSQEEYYDEIIELKKVTTPVIVSE